MTSALQACHCNKELVGVRILEKPGLRWVVHVLPLVADVAIGNARHMAPTADMAVANTGLEMDTVPELAGLADKAYIAAGIGHVAAAFGTGRSGVRGSRTTEAASTEAEHSTEAAAAAAVDTVAGYAAARAAALAASAVDMDVRLA